jgi:hypothetical protein
MVRDVAQSQESDVPGLAQEYERESLSALAADDWHLAYEWAKGWASNAGGRSVQPWLVHVASALMLRQPKTAVHACDMALQRWIELEKARGLIHFVRGQVVRLHMRDPKTALADLDEAARSVPSWLADEVTAAATACRIEAEKSRKRKPSVQSAPVFAGTNGPWAPTPIALQRVDDPPNVWSATMRIIKRPL